MIELEWWSRSSDDVPDQVWSSDDVPDRVLSSDDDLDWVIIEIQMKDDLNMKTTWKWIWLEDEYDDNLMMIQWWSRLDEDDLKMKMSWWWSR